MYTSADLCKYSIYLYETYQALLHFVLTSDYIFNQHSLILIKISYLMFNSTFSYHTYSHMTMTQIAVINVLEILYSYLIRYLNENL